MTPGLALIATIFGRRTLSRVPGVTLPAVGIGMVAAVSLFLLEFGHQSLTSHGLRTAASGDETEERAGLRLLRAFGGKAYMLDA